MKKFIMLICIIAASATALAQPSGPPKGGHPGPPPEAYTACEGKQVGDSAELTTPSRDVITGTCEMMGSKLVLRPDNLPQGDMAPPDQQQ